LVLNVLLRRMRGLGIRNLFCATKIGGEEDEKEAARRLCNWLSVLGVKRA